MRMPADDAGDAVVDVDRAHEEREHVARDMCQRALYRHRRRHVGGARGTDGAITLYRHRRRHVGGAWGTDGAITLSDPISTSAFLMVFALAPK